MLSRVDTVFIQLVNSLQQIIWVLVHHTGVRCILPEQRFGKSSLALRAGYISLLGIFIHCLLLFMVKRLMDSFRKLSQFSSMVIISRLSHRVSKLWKAYLLVPEIFLLLSKCLALFDSTISCFPHCFPIYCFMCGVRGKGVSLSFLWKACCPRGRYLSSQDLFKFLHDAL